MDIVAIPYAAIRQFLRRVPRFFIGVFQRTFPQKSVSPRAIRGPIPLSPRELLGTGRGTGPTEKMYQLRIEPESCSAVDARATKVHAMLTVIVRISGRLSLWSITFMA